jgi:quercetin dioxygenase-like cupin family protein
MKRSLRVLLIPCVLIIVSTGLAADNPTGRNENIRYSYATAGVMDEGSPGEMWKILLDKSNLGGNELELAELTLAAGTTVPSHTHHSLEIIYVLSGTWGHEVNGHYYLLKPGMVGVVRPGDHVRHIVPKEADAKVLLIWVPGGEAKRIIDYTKGTPIKGVPEDKAPP